MRPAKRDRDNWAITLYHNHLENPNRAAAKINSTLINSSPISLLSLSLFLSLSFSISNTLIPFLLPPSLSFIYHCLRLHSDCFVEVVSFFFELFLRLKKFGLGSRIFFSGTSSSIGHIFVTEMRRFIVIVFQTNTEVSSSYFRLKDFKLKLSFRIFYSFMGNTEEKILYRESNPCRGDASRTTEPHNRASLSDLEQGYTHPATSAPTTPSC